jgi:hypothetical protein
MMSSPKAAPGKKTARKRQNEAKTEILRMTPPVRKKVEYKIKQSPMIL